MAMENSKKKDLIEEDQETKQKVEVEDVRRPIGQPPPPSPPVGPPAPPSPPFPMK